MRVIGGKTRGMRLQSPKGTDVRPMLDRVKEALFNILSERIPGAEALDLFAGTGALGIEALSRGARSAVFVENNRSCIEFIRRNLEHTRLGDQAEVLRCDVLRSIPSLEKFERKFDLVFADPPYEMTASASAMRPLEEMIRMSAEKGIFAPGAVLIVHHSRRVFRTSGDLPFEIYDERWYGRSGLTFLRRQDIEKI